MTPQKLLEYEDNGQLWPHAASEVGGHDVRQAYQQALAVRQLRIARGEQPRGYKIGLTNRAMWQRFNVFAPLWGTIWDTTLSFCDGEGLVSLKGTCQPKLEPELVVGMKARPVANATMDDLYDAIDWVAPGFEVVQSHLAGWKFTAADTVVDGGLHARLLVGRKVPIREVSDCASALEQLLAAGQVTLECEGEVAATGVGENVLESPLHALHHFLVDLRQCTGATDLQAGDVITTGTWTEAQFVKSGQTWAANFNAPLSSLSVTFTD